MTIAAFSDLHIQSNQDPIYISLLKELKRLHLLGTMHLFLLGDLFEIFVGEKNVLIEEYLDFFILAGEIAKKGRVIYIEGNHDFHIGESFKQFGPVEIYRDYFELETEGLNIFLEHGDLVNTADKKYLALRSFVRSPIAEAVFNVLPGTWIRWIGNQASSLSRTVQGKPKSTELSAVYHQYTKDKFDSILKSNSKKANFLLMGHVHFKDELQLTTNDADAKKNIRLQYINMGYPRETGEYLKYDPAQDRFDYCKFT